MPTPEEKMRSLKRPAINSKVVLYWLPSRFAPYANVPIPKKPNTVAIGIVVQRRDGQRLVLSLGSGSSGFAVAFDVLDVNRQYSRKFLVDHLQESFKPNPMGECLSSSRHAVLAATEEQVCHGNKIYFVDIDVKSVEPISTPDISPGLMLDTTIKYQADACSPPQRSLTKPSGFNVSGPYAGSNFSRIGRLWKRRTK